MASKVYFTDLHAREGSNLLIKLKRLMKAAGFEDIDFTDKYVAVKMHFGEPGNMSHIRPQYAKVVCDYIKELGGRPFLTDCNTLYVGGRKNALDHLETADANGFNPLVTGVHCIIADGIKGTDEALVPLEGTKHIKEAKIGRALMDADIVVSLTHFKGHISAGFGGAIKNLGMGGGSRRGKLEMHNQGQPAVFEEDCIGCGTCVRNCANDGIHVLEDHKAHIDPDHCVGCGFCMTVCPKDAISTDWSEASDVLNEKMAEYTWAIIKDRPNFHVSLAMDISPNCDCEGFNDVPIVPSIGMFASFDPVALDQACYDAVQKQPVMGGSSLERRRARAIAAGALESDLTDYFQTIHPKTHGEAALAHGEALGMGSREYELVTV